MRGMSWAIGVAMLAMVAAGCATTNQQSANDSDKEYVSPPSIYSILDTTALVYTDPAAGSTINDHPLRWLGFLGQPFGHALDYGLNRPMYKLGGSIPYLFGYTAEDTAQDALRR